ncbi:MAG: right-handed parallel beta-helix repeat-containing protein, partial [bacterium]|nr:right-handed parallel beta-helix repeat-containing protein [bacterium]
ANSATGIFHRGAGLYDCDGTIQNNTITDNEATDAGGGLSMCDGTIGGNVIARNSANYGGGLHSCDGTIRNNIITGNSAEWGGGALGRCRGAIRNCIIWGNRGPSGPQLQDSSIPTYSCIEGWSGGGDKATSPRNRGSLTRARVIITCKRAPRA